MLLFYLDLPKREEENSLRFSPWGWKQLTRFQVLILIEREEVKQEKGD